MIDSKVEKIINKPRELWAVHRTRERLRSPEQALNAEPARPLKFGHATDLPRHLLFGIAS